MCHTRLDVAFVVSLVSQFMHQQKEIPLRVALRIVQYLKGTPGKGILLKQNWNVNLKYIQMLTMLGQLWIGDQLLDIVLSLIESCILEE